MEEKTVRRGKNEKTPKRGEFMLRSMKQKASKYKPKLRCTMIVQTPEMKMIEKFLLRLCALPLCIATVCMVPLSLSYAPQWNQFLVLFGVYGIVALTQIKEVIHEG